MTTVDLGRLPRGQDGQVIVGQTGKSPKWGNASIVSGTAMLFRQTAAPTGWTKVTTYNDVGIRVVNGTINQVTANTAFSTVFAQTAVGSHTLAASEQASMSVTGSFSGSASGTGGETVVWRDDASHAIGWTSAGGVAGLTQGFPVTSGSISGTASGGGGAHTHTVSLALNFVDVIIATKD
jgi:hypothetical protein